MEAAEHFFDGDFADVVDEPGDGAPAAAKPGSSRKARMIVLIRHYPLVFSH